MSTELSRPIIPTVPGARPAGRRRRRTCRTTPRARAFTLIEATMCLLIIGGMILSSVAVVGAIARGRPVQSERQRAVGLAEQLMTEIMQCAFQDPDGGTVLGRDAGETGRATYDDVDDYEGWEGSILTRKDGTPLAGYDGWKRRVKVTYVTPGNPNAGKGSTETSRKRGAVTGHSPPEVTSDAG